MLIESVILLLPLTRGTSEKLRIFITFFLNIDNWG